MERGAEVIAQGALSDGEWFGRPDVLRRVAISSRVWEWSYEVADTKLARETKAATILQLSLYSDLLGKIQETMPEFLWVVPPGEGFAGEKYRVSEYAAYFTDTCGSVCARRTIVANRSSKESVMWDYYCSFPAERNAVIC